MNSVITVTTDFGDSFASAQLHAVVASLGCVSKVIENHDVTSFSIIEGAFQIQILSGYCPPGSVHLGVIDPGVGSTRAGIIIQTENFWFVGPDNGLLYPAASRDGIRKVWKIRESEITEQVSRTFHGRDVFIKAAVFLSQGFQPEDFHSVLLPHHALIPLYFQEGHVLHVDHYGNVKIHSRQPVIPGSTLFVTISDNTIAVPVVETFSEVGRGQPLALFGSSGTLELAINMGNAAMRYGIGTGDVLRVGYETGEKNDAVRQFKTLRQTDSDSQGEDGV